MRALFNSKGLTPGRANAADVEDWKRRQKERARLNNEPDLVSQAEAAKARQPQPAQPRPLSSVDESRIVGAPVPVALDGVEYLTRCPRMATIRAMMGPAMRFLRSRRAQVAEALSAAQQAAENGSEAAALDKGLSLLAEFVEGLAAADAEGQQALGVLLADVFALGMEPDAAFAWLDALPAADGFKALEVAATAVPFKACWNSLAQAFRGVTGQ